MCTHLCNTTYFCSKLNWSIGHELTQNSHWTFPSFFFSILKSGCWHIYGRYLRLLPFHGHRGNWIHPIYGFHQPHVLQWYLKYTKLPLKKSWFEKEASFWNTFFICGGYIVYTTPDFRRCQPWLSFPHISINSTAEPLRSFKNPLKRVLSSWHGCGVENGCVKDSSTDWFKMSGFYTCDKYKCI